MALLDPPDLLRVSDRLLASPLVVPHLQGVLEAPHPPGDLVDHPLEDREDIRGEMEGEEEEEEEEEEGMEVEVMEEEVEEEVVVMAAEEGQHMACSYVVL